MKLSRDSWLALAVLALLVATFAGIGIQQSRSITIPYASTSSAPDGTLALRQWLGGLGYKLSESRFTYYQPPENTDLVLILGPFVGFDESELETLNTWIENGGTLVLAGDSFQALAAFQTYEFDFHPLEETAPALPAGTPLLQSPPQIEPAPTQAAFYFSSDRQDFVTLLAWEGKPLIVSFREGKGNVILSVAAYPFSNAGLKEQGNAALVLDLISAAGSRKTVWFDEWHHGQQGSSIIGPSQWLRHTSPGHALLFGAMVIFLALMFQGQAFGRPVPLPHELRRRSPLEHVTAVANLNRKAGHRGAVLQQYRQQLKRQLGRRYRLDPSLPDAEYARILAGYNPTIDQKELLGLLDRLSQKNISEGELVSLAERASKWIRDR